jgi:hypothetical protein
MAEVVQMERPAKAYSCDACGSRDPHCKACAKAREAAEKLENKLAQDRKRANAYNDRKRLSRERNAENIEELPLTPEQWEEGGFLNDSAEFAAPPSGTNTVLKIRGFLFRAKESVSAANLIWINGVQPTKEMRDAADAVIEAWQAVAEQIGAGRPAEYAESEGTEPTQNEILADIFLLLNAASETTREKVLQKVAELARPSSKE